jgi:hypothetical protein
VGTQTLPPPGQDEFIISESAVFVIEKAHPQGGKSTGFSKISSLEDATAFMTEKVDSCDPVFPWRIPAIRIVSEYPPQLVKTRDVPSAGRVRGRR